jgi:hypothetical protein
MFGVRGQKNGLDSVTSSNVERVLAPPANRQMSERDRRSVHARHVVCIAFSHVRLVRGDEQLIVRHKTRRAKCAFGVLDEQSSSRKALVQLRREHVDDACARDRNSQKEKPQEHRQYVGVP